VVVAVRSDHGTQIVDRSEAVAGVVRAAKALPDTPGAEHSRVLFVTVGQAPRRDIVPELLTLLDRPIDAEEVGVLDGLDASGIAAYAVAPEEASLTTSLANGMQVVISRRAARDRISAIVGALAPGDFDLVVVLTTGLSDQHVCACPLLNAQDAMDATIMALISSDQAVGIIHPLERQIGEIVPAALAYRAAASYAREHDRAALATAVMDLADCDVIVMNSVSYTEADRDLVARASRKPVLAARRITASAVRLMLQSGRLAQASAGVAAVRARVASLTPREREVLHLVCDGLTNRAVANHLGISPRTVEIHRGRVMQKMEAPSLAALIHAVVQCDLNR
jgi:protein AroM